jgi:hypothetical protein
VSTESPEEAEMASGRLVGGVTKVTLSDSLSDEVCEPGSMAWSSKMDGSGKSGTRPVGGVTAVDGWMGFGAELPRTMRAAGLRLKGLEPGIAVVVTTGPDAILVSGVPCGKGEL